MTIKHILLVEDDRHDIDMTLHVLQKHCPTNHVDVVRDGKSALDYLHRRGHHSAAPSQQPVVVLLDIKMPMLDGIDVLREMKSDAALKTIPVVMLTSSGEHHDLQKCYALGVNAYIVKPVGFEQFSHAVKAAGVFWGAVNEPPLNAIGNRA